MGLKMRCMSAFVYHWDGDQQRALLSPFAPLGSIGRPPWISTSLLCAMVFASCHEVPVLVSVIKRGLPPVGFRSTSLPLALGIIVQNLSCYIPQILPKCMTDPSPLSGFDFNVDLFLVHVSPQVYICYLVRPPNPQYVSKTVVNKHL